MASESNLVAELGYELGELYDAHMNPQAGADWLEQLRQARLAGYKPVPLYKKKLALHDFSFCLTEPAKNANSPLRACLSGGGALYDLMDKAVALRNATLHGDAKYDIDELAVWAATFGKIAELNGLAMADECVALTGRVDQLREGKTFEGGVSDDLQQQLLDQEARSKTLADQVATLRKSLSAEAEKGAQDSAQTRELQDLLKRAELEKTSSEEALRLAQAALEAQRVLERAAAELSAAIAALKPGEPWPDNPPQRALRLLPFVRDLFDPAADDLLSNQVGSVANHAAERWLEFLPHGGDVLLTEGGHGVALIAGAWTYVGKLDG